MINTRAPDGANKERKREMQKKMFWRDAGVNALDHFEKYD